MGSKKNSKRFTETWIGDKRYIDTVDGDIPVSALLTSTSLRDSQVALPRMDHHPRRGEKIAFAP